MSIIHHQSVIMTGASPDISHVTTSSSKSTNSGTTQSMGTYIDSAGVSGKSRCWIISYYTTGSVTATHQSAKFENQTLTQVGSGTTSLDRGRAISASQWYLLETGATSVGTGVRTPPNGFQLSVGSTQDGWIAHAHLFYYVNQTNPINNIISNTAGDIGTNAPFNLNSSIGDSIGQMVVTGAGAADPTGYDSLSDEIIPRSGFNNLSTTAELFLDRASNDMGVRMGHGYITSDPETIGWTIDYPHLENIDAMAARGCTLRAL